MTTDDFTTTARVAGRQIFITDDPDYPDREAATLRAQGFTEGAEWARTYLAEQEATDAARIIDAHRENERWFGNGVRIECVCGHTSHATYDLNSGPITESKNNLRDAERMHAVHVATVLAVGRDAR